MKKLKPLSILPSLAVIACLAVPVLADDRDDLSTTHSQSTYHHTTSTSALSHNQALGMLERASKVIGMDVKNNQQEKVGDVKNLIVDLTNGRIIAVIVGSGGFLGLGDTLSAVPPEAFQWGAAKDTLLLDVSKDAMKGHPSFKESQWPEFSDPNYVSSLYQAYHVQPYFTVPASSTTASQPLAVKHLGYGLRSNKLIGMDVKNNNQDKVGDVNNLMVDIPNGHVAAVIVSSGGFLGIGDTLSAIPPQAFQLNPTRDTLLLNVTKDALTSYPHFKGNQWPQFSDPNYLASIYQAYNIPPYWTSEAVGATSATSVTGTAQGSNISDKDMVSQVKQAIIGDSNLSHNAHDVSVILSNGQILLKGQVNSETEKNRVLDLARQAAPNEKIVDQMEVK